MNIVWRKIYPFRSWVRLSMQGLVAPGFWCLANLVQRFSPSHRKDAYLCVVYNSITWSYSLPFARLYQNDPDATVYFTCTKKFRSQLDAEDQKLFVGWVSLGRALLTRWKLIQFSAHYFGAFFTPNAVKLYYSHGLTKEYSKTNKANLLDFGDSAMLSPNRLVYDLVCVNNESEKLLAEQNSPRYQTRAKIIGDLLASELLSKQNKREDYRAMLGIPGSEKCILLMSTWGTNSLLSRWGNLSADIVKPMIASGAKVYVLSHINNEKDPQLSQTLTELSEVGVSLIGFTKDPWKYLLAADAAVGDKGSLSLYFSLLSRPLAFASIDSSVLVPGGAFRRLFDSSPTIAGPQDVPAWLDSVSQQPIIDRSPFLERYYPCSKKADVRMRLEIKHCLQIRHGDDSLVKRMAALGQTPLVGGSS